MRLSIAPPAKRQAWEKTAHRICLSPSGLYRQRGVWQAAVCVAAPERERERERQRSRRGLTATPWLHLAGRAARGQSGQRLFILTEALRHPRSGCRLGSARNTRVWPASDGSWAGKVDVLLWEKKNLFFEQTWNMEHLHIFVSSSVGSRPFHSKPAELLMTWKSSDFSRTRPEQPANIKMSILGPGLM